MFFHTSIADLASMPYADVLNLEAMMQATVADTEAKKRGG